MLSIFPTASLTVKTLFSAPFLISVPGYQRPYSWEMRQAGQLLTDLMEAAGLVHPGSGDPDYFLGTILLMDGSDDAAVYPVGNGPLREFDVVDGQQRVVTLSILLGVLRDLDDLAADGTAIHRLLSEPRSAREPQGQFRLKVKGADQAFLERYVLFPGGCAEMPFEDDLSSSQQCLLAARELFVAELTDLSLEQRRALTRYILDHCYVVVIVSRDIDRAYRLFTVINERGKRLARNDILKADVLRSVGPDDVAAVAAAWDRAAAELGFDFENFFGHLRAAYGHVRPQIVAAVRQIIKQEGGARAFVDTALLPMSRAYKSIRDVGQQNCTLQASIRKPLVYLGRVPEGDWAPSAMIVLMKYGSDPDVAARLLGEIDRISHTVRLLCQGAGKRQARFANVAKAIWSGAALEPDCPAFQITREEQKTILFHLKDFHRRNPQMCKLLLLRLCDEIDGTTTLLDPRDYTVEHVLPQRPSATSEWRRVFPDGEEREACTESLGNLVLIGQRQNDRARNLPFAKKQDIYREVSDGAHLLAITRDVTTATSWLPGDIRAREQRMIDFIGRMLRLDLDGGKFSRRTSGQGPLTPS